MSQYIQVWDLSISGRDRGTAGIPLIVWDELEDKFECAELEIAQFENIEDDVALSATLTRGEIEYNWTVDEGWSEGKLLVEITVS